MILEYDDNSIWQFVQDALDTEIEAILHFRKNLDPSIVHSIRTILSCHGKVICTGVGKSGDIAKKVSSTLSSTGTPAVFLHPTDALHGDAGIIQKEDVILAIGKSGESEELTTLLPTIKRIGSPIISITANPSSTLARASNFVILTPVSKEACPLALAPTSSTTIALMVGDAIAMTLMKIRNFRAEDFALYHPAGRLGKRLSLHVDDVMRTGERIPKVKIDTGILEVLEEMSTKMMGATAVVSDSNELLGIVTDYDVRKMLQSGFRADLQAKDIMNSNPTFFLSGMSAYDVLVKMESRSRPISVAPILDTQNRLIGMVLLHDLLQKGL